MLRLLPLGDSITEGYDVPGGYRWRLGERLREAGVTFEFVGSLENGPDDWRDRHHEGHSGWRIDQLQAHIHEWLATAKPDWVMLMIGTNDIVQNWELSTALARLTALVEAIVQDCPQGTLAIATVPPILDFFPVGSNLNAHVNTYNDGVRSLVQDQQAQGRSIQLVDAYPVFAPEDLPDGVHPNRTGQDKLGELWFQTLITGLMPPTV